MKFIILAFAIFFALVSICCTFEAFFYGYRWLSKKYETQIDDNYLWRKYFGNILGAWVFTTLAISLVLKLYTIL